MSSAEYFTQSAKPEEITDQIYEVEVNNGIRLFDILMF